MGLVENGGGLSIADAMALAGNRNEGGLFEGNSAWVFFLFFLLSLASILILNLSLRLYNSWNPAQPIFPVAPVMKTVFFILI